MRALFLSQKAWRCLLLLSFNSIKQTKIEGGCLSLSLSSLSLCDKGGGRVCCGGGRSLVSRPIEEKKHLSLLSSLHRLFFHAACAGVFTASLAAVAGAARAPPTITSAITPSHAVAGPSQDTSVPMHLARIAVNAGVP